MTEKIGELNKPPINDISEKVGSRYYLIYATSKRAREIMEKDPTISDNIALEMAIEELANDKLTITQNATGDYVTKQPETNEDEQ